MFDKRMEQDFGYHQMTMDSIVGDRDRAPAAVPGEWPKSGLEKVDKCPVCDGTRRSLLLENLVDTLFYCAPGKWNLYSCQVCHSAFLDPRPTPDTIGMAYTSYYTHESSGPRPADELTGVRRLQRMLANGYKNWKFGTDLQPSSRFGILAASVLRHQKAILDRQFRHLKPGTGRVLDIGFGDGGFLEHARSIGWQAQGVDVDEEAVRAAKERGLDVRLGSPAELEGPYDAITMSHVIEHLHYPRSMLRECFRLLAPGGTLWIETPNARSVGLKRLGRGWLAADAPRHLILFNRESLEKALRDAGFEQVRDLPIASPVRGLYAMSPRIVEGKNPYSPGPVPMRLRAESLLVTAYEWFTKSRREYLAVTAIKPA